jgi:hypothetical protein
VPNTREQLEGHEERIKAIEGALKLANHTSSNDKSRWIRIVQHPSTPLLSSLVMTILTIIGGGIYLRHLERADHNDEMHTNELIDAKLKPIGESLSGHGEKLAKIEGELQVLLAIKGISDSARHAKDGNVG